MTLGCGEDVHLLLTTRGGERVLAELSPVDGRFSRMLDGTSELSTSMIVGGAFDVNCCEDLSEIRPWATELCVFWDGLIAWCGPVVQVTFTAETVSLVAKDLTAWWSRRAIPTSSYANTDLATIFQNYHDQAMDQDASPNFTIAVTPTNITGSRTVKIPTVAWTVMSELAQTAVDFTAYGRVVLVGGQEVPAQPHLTLQDSDFEAPLEVGERGDLMANRVIVVGAPGITAEAEDTDFIRFYGLVERVFYESTILDESSAQALANTRLAIFRDPTFLQAPQGKALKSTAPMTLAELIPGARIRVASDSTCRTLTTDFRLRSVEVDFTGKVTPGLEPLGTVEDLNA